MKNLLLLLILTSSNTYAQLRIYQDDNVGGGGSEIGAIFIVVVISLLLLIFGGDGGRSILVTFYSLVGFPVGLALLGNEIFPHPKIGGDMSVAGLIGIFLGLYLWLKFLNWIERKK